MEKFRFAFTRHLALLICRKDSALRNIIKNMEWHYFNTKIHKDSMTSHIIKKPTIIYCSNSSLPAVLDKFSIEYLLGTEYYFGIMLPFNTKSNLSSYKIGGGGGWFISLGMSQGIHLYLWLI